MLLYIVVKKNPTDAKSFGVVKQKLKATLMAELYGLCSAIYSVDIGVYDANLAKLFHCSYMCKQFNCTLNLEIFDLSTTLHDLFLQECTQHTYNFSILNYQALKSTNDC